MKRPTLIVCLALALVACGSATEPAPVTTPKPEPTPTPFAVSLYCPDCADAGTPINLWSTPSRSGISGTADHGDTCTVTDNDSYQGLLHYKVTCGSQTGWVSVALVVYEMEE